jgi:hypothetical protein
VTGSSSQKTAKDFNDFGKRKIATFWKDYLPAKMSARLRIFQAWTKNKKANQSAPLSGAKIIVCSGAAVTFRPRCRWQRHCDGGGVALERN